MMMPVASQAHKRSLETSNTNNRMVSSPRSLIVLFIALSQLAVLSSAWSLADRVSGRYAD
jgi:hypothetical protein